MKRVVALICAFIILFSFCSCDKNKKGDTVFFDKKETKVIAHRGLSGLEIENTKEAFTAAGKRSYYGIEADVRKTADGKFVICHDETLKRLSGKNIKIEESLLKDLLDVVLRNGDQSSKGRLCELSTYISICKSYQKQAILELKSDFSKQEIAQIVDIIRLEGYVDNVTFISFQYRNLEYVRQILPEQPVQYLFSKLSDDIIEKLISDKIDAAISYSAFTEEALATLHNAGLTVNCWTVDDKETAEYLASLGVDYITTNILE